MTLLTEAGRVDSYPFEETEARWQARWESDRVFEAEPSTHRKKFSIFELPPFPSGRLHMGHVRNYVLADACARYRRLSGYTVLYTTGYDAFGLPNDNAAREHGCHPADWTNRCVDEMGRQFIRLGLSHDRRRIISYHVPEFYRWSQWLFLKLLHAGYAYRAKAVASWCASCRTTLSRGQVEEGKCWRCHGEVESRLATQWFVRETEFSDELLEGLSDLSQWPDRIRRIQYHWIGRVEAFEVRFRSRDVPHLEIPVVTSAPEGIYGVTFVALSPFHGAIEKLSADGAIDGELMTAIENLRASVNKVGSANQRGVEGVRLGIELRHPITDEAVPLVVASYVDVHFGKGAVMGVPAHDPKDGELADLLGLPSRCVIFPPEMHRDESARHFDYADDWVVATPRSDQMASVSAFRDQLCAVLEALGAGGRRTVFRMRDWLVSRQRYWGPPIPVIYCESCGTVPVPENHLPVLLPHDVDLTSPGNPLEFHREFVSAPCPRCSRIGRRETDTLDTFFNGVWPFLWYCKSLKGTDPFDDDEMRYWMPIDLAIGGYEHATTVYFHDRVFIKAMKRLGHWEMNEPFRALLAIEMITQGGQKMSKSAGNVVEPDALIEKYGADSVRLGILGSGNPTSRVDWWDGPVKAGSRFLTNLWRFVEARQRNLQGQGSIDLSQMPCDTRSQAKLTRRTRAAVRLTHQSMETMQFHLSCKNVMRLFDMIQRFETETRVRSIESQVADDLAIGIAINVLLHLLAPLAPHVAEELWRRCGNEEMLAGSASWPTPTREEQDARYRST